MTEKSHDTREKEFVQRLATLDAGDRARLRRNAGNTLAGSHDVLGLFFRILPYGVPEYQQEQYFTVASLYPLADPSSHPNLGATLRHARSLSNSNGLDRRVETLLDTDIEALAFRLRQAVRFAQSNRVGVHWSQLLHDVLRWNSPYRTAQKQWARAYFGHAPAITTQEATTTEA